MCEKRGFAGKQSARASIQSLHHTVHVYFCPACRRWHVAKRQRLNARRKPR